MSRTSLSSRQLFAMPWRDASTVLAQYSPGVDVTAGRLQRIEHSL
jgi:hypothetical protein